MSSWVPENGEPGTDIRFRVPRFWVSGTGNLKLTRLDPAKLT